MEGADRETQAAFAAAELQQFLLFLGSALSASGEAVNEVQVALKDVATAYGAPHARIAVLPTLVVVALDPRRPATLEPTQQLRGVLRLDQSAAIYEILRSAKQARIDPSKGHDQILDIVRSKPRFHAATVVFAHVVLTIGICLVLQPTPQDLVLAAGFGLLVGVLKQIGAHWQRVQMIMPVAAAFLVSGLTFALARHGVIDADLRAMIAPLVTFLPGAALTTAVIELSAAEMVTGASRLVSGALQLVLLGFGIVAGADLAGLPTADQLVNTPENLLGWWAPWLGVVVFGVGVYIYNSAPKRSFGWLMVVLMLAWVGQTVGGHAVDGYVSGFVGGFVMTVSAKLIERLPTGPPALVLFLPAFWLLVPGALSLIGVTEYLNAEATAGVTDFVGAVGAIIAIALGVLCGYPLVSSVSGSYERTRRQLLRKHR